MPRPQSKFRLRNIVRNPHQDVAEELRFHLDMRAEELMQKGLSSKDAQQRSVESFGDVGAIEAECRTLRDERGREQRRREWWSDLRVDARYAIRSLRRTPLFAITAILTLAIGIGGAVGGFTLVNGVLLRPLPYHEPQRLVMAWMRGTSNGKVETQWPFSIPNFLDLKSRVTALSSVAAFRAWPYTLRDNDAAVASEIVPSARVSPELFEVLGVRPLYGRGFAANDAKTGGAPVAVISNELWRRRFNASPAIVGKQISLSGIDFTVVGIMPSGFSFPRGAELPGGLQFAPRTELWTPLTISERELTERGTGNIAVVGRLANNATVGTASADLARVIAQLNTEYPRYFGAGSGAAATVLSEQAAAPVSRGLWLLMGAVGVVLLIACVNIANLLLARASNREHELAVRRALGASRARVLQQLVTENVILAVAGAAIGFGVAATVTRVLVARIPSGLPRADDVVIDWRVFLATLIVTISVGVAFGFVTAANGPREASDVVRGGARATSGRTRRAGRRALVVLEVAMSLVLLIVAGLLVQSYVHLSHVSPGFETKGAMTASVLLPIAGSFNQDRDGPAWTQTFAEFERRLSEAPGVEAVGAISSQPLSGAVESTNYVIDGAPALPPGAQGQSADYQVITPGWFRAARVPLLAGRAFDSRDARNGNPAIVVSEALVRANWPRETVASVVGRRINTGFTQSTTIVGVVGDVRLSALDAPSKPAFYMPQAQFPYPFLSFVVRGKDAGASPSALLPVMRQQLRAVNSALALDAERSFQDVLNQSTARQRFGMTVTGVFAIVALFLAVVGLYGVIATGVADRTREIGVRIALGATERDVLSTVMKEGVGVTLVGVVMGVGAAILTTRLLRDQLYDGSSGHVPIYVAVATMTAAVAVLATAVPARRAAKLNPVTALRGQ